MCDGVDYVPCKPAVLLGHHFASIAGAAPIIGPITAAAFGWLPVLLWVVIGGIFIGAVHDFSSLASSLRHRGRSIGIIIEEQVGYLGKVLFMIFCLAALILVIGAFLVIIAKTFVSQPPVATSSILFIFLALIFGQIMYRFKMPLLPASIIGVTLLALCVWLGLVFPITIKGETAEQAWVLILMGYIFLAAVIPVHLLLQPRDYLNSFLLYAIILAALIGLLVVHPKIILPAFTTFNVEGQGFLFPILFVTVACGAVSGFHSLVASGTTVKQLDNEKHARMVSYGAMLIESTLALIALVVVASLTRGRAAEIQGGPTGIFSTGVGEILYTFGIPVKTGTTFTALCVSAFALTSLDTVARVGRFIFQELFYGKGTMAGGHRGMIPAVLTNRFFAAFIMVALGGALALSGQWSAIWPLFGSANQMMAAIALLAITMWLVRRKSSSWFVQIPLYFMFAVTISALVILCITNIGTHNYVLAGIAIFLLAVTVVLIIEAIRSLVRMKYNRVIN
jgi:carbon starvation protein